MERSDILSYLVQRLDRADLDEAQFNHLLQEFGLEPPAESAWIGQEAESLYLPPEVKGEGVE